MRRTIVATLGLALVLASSAARADDAGRLKLAHEVVETAHAGDNMRALMPTFLGQMRQALTQQGGADAHQLDAFMVRFQQRFNDGIPNFIDLVAQVYAREFSDDDLRKLLDFYRSPAGQHLLSKQVMIAQGMTTVGAQWGRSIAQEITQEFEKEKGGAPSPKL